MVRRHAEVTMDKKNPEEVGQHVTPDRTSKWEKIERNRPFHIQQHHVVTEKMAGENLCLECFLHGSKPWLD